MLSIAIIAFLSIFFLEQVVVEGGLAFTAPVAATWEAGTTRIITWQDDNDSSTPMPSTFRLQLMNGPAITLKVVSIIAENISSSAGRYDWAIPSDIAPGQYTLSANDGATASYSPFFNIVSSGSSTSKSASSTRKATATASATTSRSRLETTSALPTSANKAPVIPTIVPPSINPNTVTSSAAVVHYPSVFLIVLVLLGML